MNPRRRLFRSNELGFTLVEMVMTLAVGLILVSVALPVLVGAIQNYRLNSMVQQTANFVQLARYTAIRRNAVISMLQAPPTGNTVLFIDLNGNAKLDTGEPMLMLPSDMQIANTQCPKPDPLTPGLDPALVSALASPQDFAGRISFDYRGTVDYSAGGPIGAYFLALAYTNQTQYGCRAVTVIPMGQTRLWKAPAGGSPWTWM
jgi:prepilin-type N-terminal cleavage/methylation domain-containing protein